MIRDPSDGSVRVGLTCKSCGEGFFPDASQEREPTTGLCWLCFHKAEKPAMTISRTEIDTGLRQPVRTDAQERLERSRQWLKDYHHRKEVNNAERRGQADSEAGARVRAGGEGLEQQGDRREAGD